MSSAPRSVFASLVLWLFISLSRSKAVDSFYTPFSLLDNYELRVVAKKLRIKRTNRRCFECSSLFLNASLQRGSDWKLRLTATLIDYLKCCCYTCLCCAVKLQLEFKFIYYEVIIKLVNQYDTRTSPIYKHIYIYNLIFPELSFLIFSCI